MGNYTGARIAENRQYENPSDPTNSDYNVVLGVTVPDAVIEPATGKTLTAILAEKDASINGKAAASHTHDDRYFTETEINSKLAAKTNEITAAVTAHNTDANAHTAIRENISQLAGDISRLEGEVAEIKLRVDTNITANPFSVTFKSLSGVSVSGVYNAVHGTVDF